MSTEPTTDAVRTKIRPLDQLAQLLAERQARGQAVVHCHGVFDPMHIGHIRHFREAKKLGDVVVVTVTPDRFVNKGPHRPVFPEDLRAEAVAALECVDYVSVNRWPTAIETIHLLRPNLYVKGAEFRERKDLTGAIALEEAAVQAVGGRLELTDEIVFSASNLVNRHLGVFPPDVSEYLIDFARRHPMSELIGYFDSVKPLKVLVVGETIIDEYQYVEAIGKSSKEPTLVVRSMNQERFAGGSAAVANHVAGFADRVTLQTQLGAIQSEEAFLRSKLKPQVSPQFLYRADSPTIVKRRFIENYFFAKLFEVYEINDALPTAAESADLCAALETLLPEFDVVLASDFGHGFITEPAREILSQKSRFLAINTQSNAGNLGYHVVSKYARADYISIAENELRLESRDRRGEIRPMLERVATQLGSPRSVVTRGSRGCLLLSPETGFVEVPAFATRVVDRIGAGDAFFAVTALCAAVGAPLDVLGFVGNVVGAEAVASVGNKTSIERTPLSRHIEHLLK